MMTNKQISSIYTGLVAKHGDREAYELFMEKYPDYEGELNLLIQGELEIEADPKLRQGYVDVEELMALPEASDEDDELDVSGLADVDNGSGEPLDDDEIPVPTREAAPAKADKPTKAPKAEKPAKAAAPAADKAPSKTEQALAMYNAAEDKSRKAMIAAFQDKLGMTAAGAATYFQNIKKKVGA